MFMVEHDYPEFSLRLYPFLCKWAGGSLAVAEHAQAIWGDKSELKDYNWAEADVPIVRELWDIGQSTC